MTDFVEGRKRPEDFKRPDLNVFENFYETEEIITITTDEFSAVCPATEMPDIYDLVVTYRPNAKILELKSYKMYLHTYRDWGIFVEDLAQMIAHDVRDSCDPYFVTVQIKQARRGGIETSCTVTLEGSAAE